jgi:hypothetical protein
LSSEIQSLVFPRRSSELQKGQEQRRYQYDYFRDSAWYYKRGGFKEFISAIDDKSVTIEESGFGDFREFPILSKETRKKTVQEIAASPQLMQQLYEESRDTNRMAPPKKSKLPYKKALRELELKKSLAQEHDIVMDRANAKVVTGSYEGDGVVFPYAIETVIAPIKEWRVKGIEPGYIEFIGCINDSPAIDGGEKYFSDGDYSWYNQKGKLKTATSAKEILQRCGFDTGDFYDSKKRFPCVFLINLLTPIPEWLGAAGKTHINLMPYAKDIAYTISNLAYKMPTCHGLGLGRDYYLTGGSKNENQIAKNYLRKFLIDRRAAVEADPYLKVKDRITQSGVWYRIRPEMKIKGFEPRESWTQTRRTLQSSITDVIEELWPDENLTREDLGIVAASRGVVLYDGEAWPINGDTVDALAEKGVAIIVIEKEGLPDILAPFARKYGIALAHTGGRFTNAIKRMIERATMAGTIVRILTDYDVVGLDIAAATITPTIRIGIDKDIIKWLQQNGFSDLTEDDVAEEYKPSGTTIEITDEYIMTKRIELDNVQQKVGAAKLWEYIMYRLQLPEFNVRFNVAKVIEMPTADHLRPQVVKDALVRMDNYLAKITEDTEEQILKDLVNIKKLVIISEKKNEIEQELRGKVEKAGQYDDGVKTIITKFQELLEVLPNPEDYHGELTERPSVKKEGEGNNDR